MHVSTFGYLKPTDQQMHDMQQLRDAAADYLRVIDRLLPDGADKTFIIRSHRATAMWANVAVTREADGTPRT